MIEVSIIELALFWSNYGIKSYNNFKRTTSFFLLEIEKLLKTIESDDVSFVDLQD